MKMHSKQIISEPARLRKERALVINYKLELFPGLYLYIMYVRSMDKRMRKCQGANNVRVKEGRDQSKCHERRRRQGMEEQNEGPERS